MVSDLISFFSSFPARALVAFALSLVAYAGFTRSFVHFIRAHRAPEHPRQSEWVIRGFRSSIVALAFVSFAGGVYSHQTWPLILGAAFLGEELFETGIMLLALRAERASTR